MKSSNDTVATPEAAIAAPVAAPKEPQTKTITLTANGSTMQLVAVRLREGASTYVTTTVDGSKKNIRGMSVTHESWADALASLVVSAAKAEKMGWTRKSSARGFVAKPDAFNSLPAVPKVKK